MIKDHYKHGTIEQTRRYLEERGLLPTSRNHSLQDHGPSIVAEPSDDLPEGDWRRKHLVLAPDGQRLVLAKT
jgi:hypothetical protein